MSQPPKIVCVVPTIRPESHASFVKAWTPLFEKHRVTLVTVWDGDEPHLGIRGPDDDYEGGCGFDLKCLADNRDLFCRRTDAIRNMGFVYAASQLCPDYVLTLDDDCHPVQLATKTDARGKYVEDDPIQAHLDALARRVPLGWMNTAHDTDLYLRGVPYGVRDEAPVMLSHGVWVGTPDFDGETQLRLETENRGSRPDELIVGVPHSLPYYVGPIPRGVLFPLCGMNVMVRREALPHLYYAPMGADSGVVYDCPKCVKGTPNRGTYTPDPQCDVCGGNGKVSDLHRFADIFMGVVLKREFDRRRWACVTGYSTIHHTRASDARKNFEQERLGREWMEVIGADDDPGSPEYRRLTADGRFVNYLFEYRQKRARYAALVESLLEKRV